MINEIFPEFSLYICTSIESGNVRQYENSFESSEWDVENCLRMIGESGVDMLLAIILSIKWFLKFKIQQDIFHLEKCISYNSHF